MRRQLGRSAHLLPARDSPRPAFTCARANQVALELRQPSEHGEHQAILAYSQPPSGGFPPPLKALGIAGDALADSQVDELALGHFVTARTFILLHEMGHIYFDQAATDLAQSVRNEEQADSFAAAVMQRTPLPPLGILVFFMADASWSGYGERWPAWSEQRFGADRWLPGWWSPSIAAAGVA